MAKEVIGRFDANGTESIKRVNYKKTFYFAGDFGGGTLTINAKYTDDASEDVAEHTATEAGSIGLYGQPKNGYDLVLSGATSPDLEVGVAGGDA